MSKFKDLTGEKFGRLLVEALSDRPVVKGNRHWVCRCDCGEVVTVSGFHLKSGHTASCGCLQRAATKKAKTTHGHARKRNISPTYSSWASMIKRCTNPAATNYDRYGGRGITVCDRWRDFALFLEDMGERPSLNHELDREDNDGNYEPGNCRWVTSSTNSRNRRSGRIIDTPRGRMSLIEASEVSGLPMSTLSNRLRAGCAVERLFDPARGSKSKTVHSEVYAR